MVCKVHKSGASFRGVVSYCLSEKREHLERPQDLDERPDSPEARAYEAAVAERSRRAEEVPRPSIAARVAWTETINLATDNPRVAARQMAATVDYAGELKRLSGVGAGGRKLEKPVLHYTLSWAAGETPQRPAMVAAARSSLQALGIADRQAVVVAHRDGTTPHVHVVVNRVSCEDGRSASLSQSKLKLSRWAEAHERRQGRIRCEQRVENNRLRRSGRRELPLKQPLCRSESDARYRRKGEIEREQIMAGRTVSEIAGVALRRVDEANKWRRVREDRDAERHHLDRAQRRAWRELYARQGAERDRLAEDCRTLRGRVNRWRETEQQWTDLYGVARGKPWVIEGWARELEQGQRAERAELGREQSRESRTVDARAQEAYREALARPVEITDADHEAIAAELLRLGVAECPRSEAESFLDSGRAIERIEEEQGITIERTRERDFPDF